MNCQQFDKIALDLARNQSRGLLMDAQVKAGGLAHADECERCAARLDDERALNVGLSVLGAIDASCEAPAHVESALLAAFRQQATVATHVQTATTSTNQQRIYWLRWAVAAAAIITLAMLGWSQLLTRSQQTIVKTKGQRPKTEDTIKSEQRAVEQHLSPDEKDSGPIEHALSRPQRRAGKQLNPSLSGWDNAQTVDLGEMQVVPQVDEVATDFIPINYTGSQTPPDSVQVIRMTMPRAALTSFGLPVNVERSHEPIKADVVYGSDGLARAVRFINE